METGEKLKQFRIQNGLTQGELAEEIGTHQQTVSKWECGKRIPTFDQAKQLAKLYGVAISDIVEEYAEVRPSGELKDQLDDELETVTIEDALDYIDWTQGRGNQCIKSVLRDNLVITLCAILGYVAESKYVTISFVTLVLYMIVFVIKVRTIRKIDLDERNPKIELIESGEFRVTDDAEQMIYHRRDAVKDSMRTATNTGTIGMLMLLLWYYDKVIDTNGMMRPSVIIIFSVGFSIICAICMPTLNYWVSICKLLKETKPQILTPFNGKFWRKQK